MKPARAPDPAASSPAQPRRRRRPPGRCSVLVLMAAVLSILAGCRLAEKTVKLPVDAVAAVIPAAKSGAIDPAALQLELQRAADEYTALTAGGVDEYAKRVGTPEAHLDALRWKIATMMAVVSFASGPNPRSGLLDFLAQSTIVRTALEDAVRQSTNRVAFEPWLEISRGLETNVWRMARGVLTADQQQELQEAAGRWWVENRSLQSGFFARLGEFGSISRHAPERSDRSGSVFSLVGLDPMAGLDPAVREVTRTRLFAERAMFTLQRMPFLVRWQAELLAHEVIPEERIDRILGTTDRISRAAESTSQTVAQLPDRIAAERQALVSALEKQEGRLRELSAEITRTLAAGESMSTSLNTTITTFDGLMKRFGIGEPRTTPPRTNARPFSILDYAHTAEQIATMAREVDALVKDTTGTLDSPALDRRLAELKSFSAQAQAGATSVLNHAFLLGAGLIVLLFAGAVVYRRAGGAAPGPPTAARRPPPDAT